MKMNKHMAKIREREARTRHADWGYCRASGESRWPWLARVKARWNVTLYRLSRNTIRGREFYPSWYLWLWWD